MMFAHRAPGRRANARAERCLRRMLTRNVPSCWQAEARRLRELLEAQVDGSSPEADGWSTAIGPAPVDVAPMRGGSALRGVLRAATASDMACVDADAMAEETARGLDRLQALARAAGRLAGSASTAS